jgi:hypothetical protein
LDLFVFDASLACSNFLFDLVALGSTASEQVCDFWHSSSLTDAAWLLVMLEVAFEGSFRFSPLLGLRPIDFGTSFGGAEEGFILSCFIPAG